MITIELFGVARLRAGRDVVTVEAASLGEAIVALAAECPALDPSVVQEGRLSPHHLIARNGLQITSDPALPLDPGDTLVLISADAGG